MSGFEEMLHPVYGDIVRYARALARDTADGDDLVQEALLKAWLHFPKLRDPSVFRSWLLKIVRNEHISRERKRCLRSTLGLEDAHYLAVDSGLPLDEKEAVRQALAGVPRNQREAVVLHEVVGLPVAEIARIQGIGLSAAKNRLSRGRIRLREEYLRLFHQEEPGHEQLAEVR